MKSTLTYLLLTLVCMMFSSCDRATTDETISLARKAIQDDDYTSAQRLLDEASHDNITAHLTSEQLLEMAVLYRELGEHSNEGENFASALRCYERAAELDPESVDRFVASLPVEQKYYLLELRQVSLSAELNIDEEEQEATDILETEDQ